MKKLSIIIPVYNEERTVAKLLKKVLSTNLPVEEIEYIVVDDGSTDKSKSEIEKLKTKKIKLFSHKKNLGKGAAVKTSLLHATGDYVVIQDADLEYDPQEIAKLVKSIEEGKAQVVYGTRLKRLPNFSRDERTFRFLLHYLGNKFLSLLTSILYFHWVTDMETCYKLFPKKALDGVTLDAKGFELEPEITAKLLKRGYKIFEVPITTNPRTVDEGKKLNTIHDGSRALWTLLKYRFIPLNKEEFYSRDSFQIGALLILLLAIILRFINFDKRFVLAYDQAHDALLAQYAVMSHHLPLLGPFSSAGPFQTGGEWYWIIMIGTIIFPYSLKTPWVFMAVIYVFFVLFSIVIGKEIGGKKFALIAGIFAALSTAEIVQATNLTNQSPLAIISLFGIWCAIKYLKSKSNLSIFLLGLCIGIASSIHLSGVALVCLAVSLAIVERRVRFSHVGLFILGIVIPWIPVFYVDSQNNFLNIKHMIQYYLHDQYKIPLEALGRRWLTYLSIFWPNQWANIIGFFPLVGYIELISLFCVVVIYRKYLTKEIIVLLLSVFFMIIILRYTHTPLFDTYLTFMHPFIFFLTSWAVFILLRKIKILGIVLLLIISFATFYRDFIIITSPTNSNTIIVNDEMNALHNKYKGEKIAVYTYKEAWKDKNYILSLYLTSQHELDSQGVKVSTVVATQEGEFTNPVLYGSIGNYELLDLSSSSRIALVSQGWRFVDGKSIYEDTEEWFKKDK
jgi:dolichol-phosphate mannosyltransferase